MVEERKSPNSSSIKGVQHKIKPSNSVRVSFRDDVVFPHDQNKMLDVSSLRSRTSDTSSNSGSNSSYSQSSPSPQKYSKLRSSLIREQMNRDPFFFYQVTKSLGSGSMGEVKLVKKRPNKIGGSARRDIQEAVKRQQREKECLKLPVIGNLFEFCMDGNLKDDLLSENGSSHHSLSSFLSVGSSTHSRSFEDSFLNKISEKNSSESKSTSQIIYAMKSIHLDQVTRKEFVDELRNEIAILKDLDHPNIVRAIETFEWNDKISIVMELCSGGDLYSRDPYKENDAARIIGSVLNAIAYMHSRNIVHRDLKFENVLFVNASPMSDVKLIDFGLSKVYVDNKEFTDISGTIYTMAPEVLMGNHTEKADMWSIGVVAFMLLASALPFYGKERKQVAMQILHNKYSFGGRRWQFVSSKAQTFIRDLLVTNPDHRDDAEHALKSPWLKGILQTGSSENGGGHRVPRTEEEELARSSILRYASYSKLKKMALMVVAHKSSSEEIGILLKLFQKYGSRHDGSIWFEDFCQAMGNHNHSNEELRVIFDAMDLSGSGSIRYTEFIAATIEAHGAINEARLAEAFDRLDCDDSGYITAENLVDILGEDVPMEEIFGIIDEADLAKDHRVSYSEFMALWEDTNTMQELMAKDNEDLKILSGETPSITSSIASSTSDDGPSKSNADASDAHAEFLKEKHLQNTLHAWAMEMQLPAQEFAFGCSFLHQAALGNQSDLERILVERPGLVNFRDYDRRTALHIAASEGHVDVCRFLINNGARVNRGDRWGGSPLDDAHRHQRSDVVNLLRDQGAKFGSTSQTVNLITAASEGNIEEVRTLLEFGSMDLNQGDYDHRTALHLAAHEGHLEVVILLCQGGANVNVKDRWGDRPLNDARKAKKNSIAIMDVLSGAVAVGAIDSTDGKVATMNELKDHPTQRKTVSKADGHKDEGMTQLPAQEFAMGCSVLHQAALGSRLVLEKILLECSSLLNFRDYDRRTPLHIAASEGQLSICQFLVAKGARINRVDRWGGSPLDDAHRQRHTDVVNFLRDQGGKFGSTSQSTNFITAASEGDEEEVQAFLDFGNVDVNKGDYDRRTALHLAAGEGRLEIVRILCEAGADVNVEDRWGHRPLDDARNAMDNSGDIMRLLLKQGAKSKKISTKIKTALLSLLVP